MAARESGLERSGSVGTLRATLLMIALQVAGCWIDAGISRAVCWPAGGTSAKVAQDRTDVFAHPPVLDENTVGALQSACSCGFRAD
jgi:hypothetical protein